MMLMYVVICGPKMFTLRLCSEATQLLALHTDETLIRTNTIHSPL